MIGEGSSLDTRLLGFSVANCVKCKAAEHGVDTMDVIWRVFIWSLLCLARGVYPDRDWRDREIIEGVAAQRRGLRIVRPYVWAWLMVAADLDYYSTTWPCRISMQTITSAICAAQTAQMFNSTTFLSMQPGLVRCAHGRSGWGRTEQLCICCFAIPKS